MRDRLSDELLNAGAFGQDGGEQESADKSKRQTIRYCDTFIDEMNKLYDDPDGASIKEDLDTRLFQAWGDSSATETAKTNKQLSSAEKSRT